MSSESLLPGPIVQKSLERFELLNETASIAKKMSIVDLTVDIPSSYRIIPSTNANEHPPRWKTKEFKFYFVILLIALPVMVWIPVSLSQVSNPNYTLYHSRLSDGWILGRKVDNSDGQYHSVRNNLPILAAVCCLFLLLKHAWVRGYSKSTSFSSGTLHLIPFNVAFSVLFLLVLHGSSILKIFFIISINYGIASICKGSKVGPIATWTFNMAILFLNDWYHGYSYANVFPPLAFLDEYRGLRPRWHINFNVTMLRLISFSMDYHWSCKRSGISEAAGNLSEKQRQSVSHPDEMYSYMNYISYVLYSPLYIAGPIITFNDFLWQFRRPLTISGKTLLGYAIRFLVCLLTMELILHYMYVTAIKDTKAWIGNTPSELSMIGFWNLIIVWLKLLIPWRFFRLWALLDGIDPPENMVRCMANNYSTFGFWRSWHRSYNLWVIRYIYIPVGGHRNVFVNSVLVFSFVALWHDLTFRLLTWGWLVSLFLAPELLARFLLPTSKYGKAAWYRHACAAGAVCNILMMMMANLVGFVIGTEGMRYFVAELFGSLAGLKFLVGAAFCLFVGAQLMFEYREEEMRRGIYRRC